MLFKLPLGLGFTIAFIVPNDLYLDLSETGRRHRSYAAERSPFLMPHMEVIYAFQPPPDNAFLSCCPY
jgi:hypothetical protein